MGRDISAETKRFQTIQANNAQSNTNLRKAAYTKVQHKRVGSVPPGRFR